MLRVLKGNARIAAAVLLCTGAGGVGGYGQTQTELSRFLLSLSRNKNLVPNHKETADIFPFGYLSFRIYFLPLSYLIYIFVGVLSVFLAERCDKFLSWFYSVIIPPTYASSFAIEQIIE